MSPEFQAWPKIPRFNRDVTITEKIDGTNACVIVTDEGTVHAQSRKRIITPQDDNFGFARWVDQNQNELKELGPGYHYGEWYGLGIQRGYGLDHKRFALFNTFRWADEVPACCDVVPVLHRTTGHYLNVAVNGAFHSLLNFGSKIAPGFMKPEGICLYHHAGGNLFKVLLEGDDVPKREFA